LKPVSLNIHSVYFKWYDPPPMVVFLMPNALVFVHRQVYYKTPKPVNEKQIL